jgi:sugar phosphate isomerase/epimerase
VKLGLLTVPFAERSLSEVARWAAAHDYDALEVASWPRAGSEQRRYAGTAHLPIETLTQSQANEIQAELGELGIAVSALGYYPNNLDPDANVRRAANAHTEAVIRAAALLGVPVVNTFVGADQWKSADDNLADAIGMLRPLVDVARDLGVRLAIENCPMIFSSDEWPGGRNAAYCPAQWRRLFNEFDETLGLNLDPSHLVWLMIDSARVVREFGERIYHVHIKDLEIDRDGLYERGTISMGVGWQVPRLPGLGEVDWSRFIATLYAAGYEHAVVVEHEDRAFEGSSELIEAGFVLAHDVIRPLVPRA